MNRAAMQCRHPRTKGKLVLFATTSRYGHRQWQEWRQCCALCGCIVEEKE